MLSERYVISLGQVTERSTLEGYFFRLELYGWQSPFTMRSERYAIAIERVTEGSVLHGYLC
jgi:hypothetical protein